MGWSSIFRRASSGAEPPGQAPEAVDPVQHARTRARQRLIGAVVLLVIGVIGFPIVFETQPRPVAVDIPIEIPRKDGAPPLAMPPAARPVDPVSTSEPVADASDGIITETREESGREMPRASSPRAASAAPAERPPNPARGADAGVATGPSGTASSVARTLPRVEPKPPAARAETRTPVPAADAARARALLDGQPPAAASEAAPARYIVQVGAFAEAEAARTTRARLERLGLKTYTQVANTPEGSRIRVRLGPFASREEADRALAKARGAGLGAVLQVL